MMLYNVRGAILIGILLTSIISWPRNSEVTYFPHTAAGDSAFDFFKKVVTFHPLQTTGNAIAYSSYSSGKVWYALITFVSRRSCSPDVALTARSPCTCSLSPRCCARHSHNQIQLYVDIMDTTGTLYSMAKFAGLRDPITRDFEGSTMAYCVYVLCTNSARLALISPSP